MKKSIIVLCSLLFWQTGQAQDIPLGTWRTHFSYFQAQLVQETPGKVFCATENGLFFLDTEENTITTLDKTNGLNDVAVSAMSYGTATNTLVIGYESGNIDLLSENGIVNIDLVVQQSLTEDKTIRHISTDSENAYLSTDFGIVVINLERQVITEVYREIGPQGIQPQVFGTAVFNDSLFAATSQGLLKGRISQNTNLLDFNNWTVQPAPSGVTVNKTVASGSSLYFADNTELYTYQGNDLTPASTTVTQIQSLSTAAGDQVLLITDNQVLISDGTKTNLEFSDPQFQLRDAVKIGNTLYLATDKGLTKSGQTKEIFRPDGPASDQVQQLRFFRDSLFAFGPYRTPLSAPAGTTNFSSFNNSQWTNTEFPDFADVSDVGANYFSSYGHGLLDRNTGSILTDTPLLPGNAQDDLLVPIMAEDARGLWVANYNSALPLHLLSTEGNWQSYGLQGRATRITGMVLSGNIWLYENRQTGVLAFNPESGDVFSVTSSNSELPSSAINDLAIDLEDEVWIATDGGVAFIPSGTADVSDFNSPILPVFENNFLFRDTQVNTIAIDAGNRKWIGTETGAWLLEDSGEALVRRFTAENSPLPSNSVLHIAINSGNGEVFFVTAKGMASYRSDATTGQQVHGNVKIFPNPVEPGFSGLVGVSGLATDVNLKITDTSGRLVKEMTASGGGASWDLRNEDGKRVQTGVYLLFSSDPLGEETFVGKLVVIQ